MKDWYGDWLQRRGVSASLADTLEQAIRTGRLPAGARLPTHRDLSKRLGVAVSTVTRAYAEATKRGLIDATVGRGTFALGKAAAGDRTASPESPRPMDHLYLPLMQRADAINLSLNEPLTAGTDERLRHAIAA